MKEGRSLRGGVEPAIRADERGPKQTPVHIRKQIYLRPDQDRAIRLAAADRGVDQSEIIREAMDEWLKKEGGK